MRCLSLCFCFFCNRCTLSFLYFFFFKQKTAYEMRISDWSSDVCSSDLAEPRPDLPHEHADRDTQTADARLAAHDLGCLGDAIELSHGLLLDRNALRCRSCGNCTAKKCAAMVT